MNALARRATLYVSDLKELLADKRFPDVRASLRELGPVDLADVWRRFTRDERVVLFRLYPRVRASQLFEELDWDEQAELLGSLKDESAERVLADLDPGRAGRVLRRLPPGLVAKLTAVMSKGARESALRAQEYPLGSVGALARARFVEIPAGVTAKQALEKIQLGTRLRRIDETHLDPLLVTDDEGHLVGTVPLKVLVVAPRDMTVRELMDDAPRSLSPEADQEEAVRLFRRYKLKGAPVVDALKRPVGLVLVKDVLDVAQEEVEEDFAKMAGSTRSGLLSESVLRITSIRLPWLVATCLGELVVSYIIKRYEPTLERVVALATFMPLIAAMGGNVGAQTATVMVRGLATNEVREGEEVRVVLKEVAVGVLIGAVYGLLIGASAMLFYGDRYGWRFAAVVGIGMLVSMSAAATAGSIEPLVFRRLGIDPATATGPLITTFTDLASTTLYFTLATWLLL